MPKYSVSIPPPSWFDLSNYNGLHIFTIKDWAPLVAELHLLSAQGPSSALFAEWLKQRPTGSASSRSPLTFKHQILSDLFASNNLSPEPLRELTRDEAKTDFDLYCGDSFLLAVNLSATNQVLEAMFADWLAKKRESDYNYARNTSKQTKRGKFQPKNPKELFGTREFESWTSRKIVPLLDLEFWKRQSASASSISDAVLGEWLFADNYANPAQQVSYSRMAYKQAFADLEYIQAQALL